MNTNLIYLLLKTFLRSGLFLAITLLFNATILAQTQLNLPVTFEVDTVDYTMTDFGDNSTTLITDPNDNTNTVAQTTKPVGAQLGLAPRLEQIQVSQTPSLLLKGKPH